MGTWRPISSERGSASVESDECDSDMHYYMERLKVLRSRCGLDNAQSDGLPTSATMPSVASAGDLGSATFNAAYYEGRLKALRARGGIDGTDTLKTENAVNASSSNSSSSTSSDSSATAATTIASSERTSENTTAYVADLKKRLDRIKNSTRH
ncbi:hypothetical protein NP493_3g03011 [Ridgeia piscesae]|uniref:Uncharacterized protein n=1 Tax=Ridgeia piscesae TaxID=27915 RepID=A0AAD9PG80_RIDPI|nr:hypothetical protein NP493_3g03011 [Ridgeia piscesae]